MQRGQTVRPALSFWLLLTLAAALTLTMKARLNNYSAVPDETRLIRELSTNLRRQQFTATEERHRFLESTIIATRATCRMRITNGTRSNQIASILKLQSREVGVPRYYFRGEWSAQPPILRSELQRYFQLILARLGIRRSRDVIFAVASSPGCKQVSVDLTGTTIEMTG